MDSGVGEHIVMTAQLDALVLYTGKMTGFIVCSLDDRRPMQTATADRKLYALFNTIETFSDSVQNKSTESVINEELKIIEWLNINSLSLNKSKSKYMTFQMPNKTTQTIILKIDNIDIGKVEEFNFLGLTIDTDLNWKKITEKISNKCSKSIGILNRLKRTTFRN